jgi:integrase
MGLESTPMKASKSAKERKKKAGKGRTALVPRQASDPALTNAVAFWTDATTSGLSLRRHDIKRDKSNAVLSFFGFAGKHPAAVTAADVKAWQAEMEGKGLAQTMVYTWICHLSSFFRWAMKDSSLGQYLESNPVSYAHPKAPRPYQTRSAKSLTEEQVFALLNVVGARARSGDLVGKRDYALLLLYITTGMRRNEVMSLRGKEVTVEEKRIAIRGRVKGGRLSGAGGDRPPSPGGAARLPAERPATAYPERRPAVVDPARRRRGAGRAALLLVICREPEALRQGGGDRQDSSPPDAPHLRADGCQALGVTQ